MNETLPVNPVTQPVSRTKFIIGGALFVGGFLSPLLIPFVTSSDLPGNWKAILSTGLAAGLPEVGMLLAVAVLGKQGFIQLKEMFFSRFRKLTESSAVSLIRYRIGLVMFFTPLLLAWLEPYVVHYFIPGSNDSMLSVIFFDLVFAASFIVLGAEFWDKIRNLFVHRSERNSEAGHSSTKTSEGETR